jgi:hypothetical protein
MTTAYTSLLGLALPVTGELSGTWGDTVNNSITSLLDSAIAGTTTLSTDADVTLTTTTGAANTAREAILLCSGARTALRNITAPAQSKIYTVINSTTGGFSVVIRGAGPTTGVTILAGESAMIAWNGSDFIKISNTAGSGTFYTVTATAPTTASSNLGAYRYGTLSFSDTGIVQSAQTSVNSYFQNVIQNTSNGTGASAEFIAYNDQGTASTNYATVGINSSGYSGTGSINAAGYGYFLSASTDLVLGTIGANGIHFTTNSSATDALAISSAGAVSLPGGTANGVAYLNGSKVLTTGSALTFDGTNFGAPASIISGSIASMYGNIFSAGNSQTWLMNNATASDTYRTSDTAQRYRMLTGVGFTWETAASGTAGAAITWSEQMRLTSIGLVIGGTSAGAKLDVVGVVRGTLNSSNIGGSGSHGFEFRNATTTTKALVGGYDSTAGAYIQAVNFGTAYTDLTLQPNGGNLGLGVTPSAWNITGKAMDFAVYGTINSLDDGTKGNFQLGYNYYQTAAATFNYKVSDAASMYRQRAGVHSWYNAPSGTAGNAITFTQAMTLSAAGNLLVGSTSLISAERLGITFAAGNQGIALNVASGGTQTQILFANSFGGVGSITTSGAATAYNTSSDYRLKNITGPITNSGAYIDSLNPVEGTWKADGSTFVGLIAHEVQEASRTPVATGTKDGEEMQAMDYSSAEIIANLIAEIQSLRKRLTALEGKV